MDNEPSIHERQPFDIGAAWRNYVSTPHENTYQPSTLAQIAEALTQSPIEIHQYGAGMAYAEAAQKSLDTYQSKSFLEHAQECLEKARIIATKRDHLTKIIRYSIALTGLPLYDSPSLAEHSKSLGSNLHLVRDSLIAMYEDLIKIIGESQDAEQAREASSILCEAVVLISLLEAPKMSNAGLVPYYSFPWQNAKKYLGARRRATSNFDIGVFSLKNRETKHKLDVKTGKSTEKVDDDIVLISVVDILLEAQNYRPDLYGPNNPPRFATAETLDPDVLAIASRHITSRI